MEILMVYLAIVLAVLTVCLTLIGVHLGSSARHLYLQWFEDKISPMWKGSKYE